MLGHRPFFALLSAITLGACGGGAASGAAPCDTAGDETAASSPRIVLMDLDEERFDVSAKGRPAKGATEPLVTVVEITDFECPFCSRAQPTLARLLDEHPEVRLVVRQNPLPMHPHALMAAEAAYEAFAQGGDAAFFRMHDLLFENQHALEPEQLLAYAERAGLDVERFSGALEAGTHRGKVVEDVELALSVGARGTPTFFVNGRPVVGAVPYEEMEAVVLEELEAARALVAQGIPAGDLYEVFRRAAREGRER